MMQRLRLSFATKVALQAERLNGSPWSRRQSVSTQPDHVLCAWREGMQQCPRSIDRGCCQRKYTVSDNTCVDAALIIQRRRINEEVQEVVSTPPNQSGTPSVPTEHVYHGTFSSSDHKSTSTWSSFFSSSSSWSSSGDSDSGGFGTD